MPLCSSIGIVFSRQSSPDGRWLDWVWAVVREFDVSTHIPLAWDDSTGDVHSVGSIEFQLTSHSRGMTLFCFTSCSCSGVSTHIPLAWDDRRVGARNLRTTGVSTHIPLAWDDFDASVFACCQMLFQLTSHSRGMTSFSLCFTDADCVSTHIPLAWDDFSRYLPLPTTFMFQLTSHSRGMTENFLDQ